MRLILTAIVLCACGDAPAAEYLEPCDAQLGCAGDEDFCATELGLCTHVCRVANLPVRSARDECLPSNDCSDSCCLLSVVWPMGFDDTRAGSGVCAPFE